MTSAGTPEDQSRSVSYERVGNCSVLTIERPQRRNAIDGPTAEQLHSAFLSFEADSQARVLIVTGAGGQAFCAGADLKELDSMVPRVADPAGPEGFTRLQASKPTIAAIDGWCVAGGLELAIWCDLRIAGEQSIFGCLERRWGVPLVDGATQRLPRIIGLGRAMDLILSGRQVQAEEALAIGLITRIVPAGTALEHALELAEHLAGYPQETLLADRSATYAGLGVDMHAGLELEAMLGAQALKAARAGAERFASGAGRGGAGSGP